MSLLLFFECFKISVWKRNYNYFPLQYLNEHFFLEEKNSEYSSGVRQSARISFDDDLFGTQRHNRRNASLLAQCLEKSQQILPEERVVEGHNENKDIKQESFKEGKEVKEDEEVGDTDSGRGDSSVSSDMKEEDLPEHLQPGMEFTFRVTVLQAMGIATEYADIFCQFKWVSYLGFKLIFSKIHFYLFLWFVFSIFQFLASARWSFFNRTCQEHR